MQFLKDGVQTVVYIFAHILKHSGYCHGREVLNQSIKVCVLIYILQTLYYDRPSRRIPEKTTWSSGNMGVIKTQ